MRHWILPFLALAVSAQPAVRLDEIVQSFARPGRFMGAVIVAKGDDVLLEKAYGHANLEWKIPNTPNTRFRIGSVTKQFTAVAFLLLEEQGRLSIDDPVSKHYPAAPPAWKDIRLKHLLSHTSGIPNFTAAPTYEDLKRKSHTPAQLVAGFLDKPLEFPPGTKWSYSNSGYILLGHILEKVTGTTYADLLRKNIFDKFGMDDSGIDANGPLIERRAAGYVPSPQGPANAAYIHMSVPHAAGALYSTPADLLRYQRALFSGKLLSPASLAKMTTVVRDDYALGVAVKKAGGRTRIEHSGGIDGFNSFLLHYPAENVTVAVLANLNGPAAATLAGYLGRAAAGESVQLPSERTGIDLPVSALAAFTGQYTITPAVAMSVTLEANQLHVQLPGQPRFPIFPQSPTRFFLKAVDAEIEFSPGALTLFQNGREIRGVRRPDN